MKLYKNTINTSLYLFSKMIRKIGYGIIHLANIISERTIKYPVLEENDKSITICIDGIKYNLVKGNYIDEEIIKNGVFEKNSVKIVKKICKKGMIAVDVGANFGYYTLLLSKLVGDEGKVYAFEPVKQYFERLEQHLTINNIENVKAYNYGLSDKKETCNIMVGSSSATLHWPDKSTKPCYTETIKLVSFDEWVNFNPISSLDFIKIDIDGHEPWFINGASNTLKKYKPIILIEFNELNLLQHGNNVEKLAEALSHLGYTLYSEKDEKPYKNEYEFLKDAKNCAFSTNIICMPRID